MHTYYFVTCFWDPENTLPLSINMFPQGLCNYKYSFYGGSLTFSNIAVLINTLFPTLYKHISLHFQTLLYLSTRCFQLFINTSM